MVGNGGWNGGESDSVVGWEQLFTDGAWGP
jgi:hypothetical protein